MKHHIVIVYQTVSPRGISHQIYRNIDARKIYLHINIPRVSSALKKNYNTKIQNNYQKTGILLYYIIVFVVLFIMHIMRNSQLRKLVEGEGSE